MAYDFNIGGQGALSGAMMGASIGGPLAPFTAAAGGILGALGGIGGKQKVPEFNAADEARNYLERFGGFDSEQGQIEANVDTVKRRTVAELISQGVDPVAARQMGEQKATEFRTRSMSDLLNAAQAREGSLTQQLLPQQFQREEDQASYRNWQSSMASQTMQGIAPTLVGGFLAANEMGLFDSGNSPDYDQTREGLGIGMGRQMGLYPRK
jgi:hypothetical protein